MEKKYNLPVLYDSVPRKEKYFVRKQYEEEQGGKCWYCSSSLYKPAPKEITDKWVNWKLFPKGFLINPIHLQHDHNTGLTEGAVHAYCNAVLWQYEGR